MGSNDFVKFFMTSSLFCGIHGKSLVDCSGDVLMIANTDKRVSYVRKGIRGRGKVCTHSEIPRVNKKCVVHVLTDTHELTKNARVLPGVVLRDNVLHAGRIHAVAQGGDDSEVCDAQKCVELVFLKSLMAKRQFKLALASVRRQVDVLVVHGDEIQASVLSIDVSNELTNHALKLGGVGKSGTRHLDHDDVADPLRVVLKQLLKCPKLYEWSDSS